MQARIESPRRASASRAALLLALLILAPALPTAAAGDLPPANEPAQFENGAVSLRAEPVPGGLAGGLVRLGGTPGHSASVETVVSLRDGMDWDERNEAWLAALLPETGGPGGAALVWSLERQGFFPTWELRLYAGPGSFEHLTGTGEIAPEAAYTVLARNTPVPGHAYRAALSVDRASGDVHVSLFNVTQNRPVYQGTLHIEPSDGDFVAASGGFARCGRCAGDWLLVLESGTVSADVIPFSASWRLLREAESGFQPFVTAYADRFEPLYAEITLPDAPLPGAARLVARSTGHSAVLLDLAGMTGRHVLPVSLAAAPGRAVTLVLEYEGPAGTWSLSTRELDVVSGTVELRINAGARAGRDFAGTLVAEGSSSAVPDIAFAEPINLFVDAAVYASTPRGWEFAGSRRIAFEGLDLRGGSVSLPFQLPLDFAEPAVVRIAFSPVTLGAGVGAETGAPAANGRQAEISEPGAGEGLAEIVEPGASRSAPESSGFSYRVTLTPKEMEFLAISTPHPQTPERSYAFDGSISREVLTNYLSRAVTMLGFADPDNQELLDDLRFIANTGAKFIGRAAYIWGAPSSDELHFQAAERAARLAHEMDPELILQACIFEAVYQGIERIPIPAWVFEEFGLPAEERNFDYEAMLFDDGRFVNHWGPGGSVPDMSKLETKMWFFYRAKRYIDAGYEAIHFGQVHLMGQNDPGFRHWQEILERIRAYARKHARRHMLLADAHTHGIVVDGKLLFDFHSYPLRIAEVPGRPMEGRLVKGRIDSIYGRSRSGLTPSGWYADPLPYLVEVDNWGSSGRGGESINEWWVWGYDEISWFAHQDEAYRNEWLWDAWNWVRENDPNGWLQMPAKRVLHDPVNGVGTYRAHSRSAANPHGFNQEQTIKAIWAEDSATRAGDGRLS